MRATAGLAGQRGEEEERISIESELEGERERESESRIIERDPSMREE